MLKKPAPTTDIPQGVYVNGRLVEAFDKTPPKTDKLQALKDKADSLESEIKDLETNPES